MATFSRFNEELTERVRLDATDLKILSILSHDSRTPTSTVGKKCRLSPESCHHRIQSLLKRKVILGFYPIIDLRQFGYHTFHVFFLLDERNVEHHRGFIESLIWHPRTRSVREFADRWDIEWVLVATSVQDFDETLNDITNRFQDLILEKRTFEIVRGYKSLQFPDPTPETHPSLINQRKAQAHDIQPKDLELLKALCENGRESIPFLAKQISMSAEGTRYRLKKLTEAGIITQFTIIPNLTLLGYSWNTMCVDAKTFDLTHELRLKEYISQKPQIIRAIKTFGNWELMLHLVTTSASELHRTTKEFQKLFVDVMVSTQTWGGYKEHMFTGLPKILMEKKES